MLIDLHLHSIFSDGLLSVEQLTEKARRKGIRFLALTDHDTLAGNSFFKKKAGEKGLLGAAGVEISVEHRGRDLHLTAYEPKRHLNILAEHLKKQREKRMARAEIVVRKLKGLGLFFSLETEKNILNQDNVGKPHLGRAVLRERRNRLILKKLFNFHGSLSDFINRFLDKPGQAGYVFKQKISAAAALKLLNRAGAKTVLAHPDLDLSNKKMAVRILGELKKDGLWGVESPRHHRSGKKFYRRLAGRLGLAITYGSDSHDGRKMGVAVNKEESLKLMKEIMG